jgi:hypothetical protein
MRSKSVYDVWYVCSSYKKREGGNGEKHNVLILSSHVFPVEVPLAWFSVLVATKQNSIALDFSEDFEPKSILCQDTESSDLLGLLSSRERTTYQYPSEAMQNARFAKDGGGLTVGFYHSRLNRQILSRGYRHVSQCLVLESNLDHERSWTHTCWSVWFMRWLTTMRRIQQFRLISNPNVGITTIGPNSHVSRRPWACASYASYASCPRFFDVAFQGLQHSSTFIVISWFISPSNYSYKYHKPTSKQRQRSFSDVAPAPKLTACRISASMQPARSAWEASCGSPAENRVTRPKWKDPNSSDLVSEKNGKGWW